ncbi:MAG: acyl carrier protein [Thermodesulfobacteriota bacterium]
MIGRREITGKVIQVLAEMLHRKPETIRMDSSLMDDLEMDSFTAIEMLFHLEDQYGIEIPDETVRTFKTVLNIVEYLENRLSQG